jgi:hypothetical protein
LDFEPAGAPRDTFNDRAIYVESEVSPLQPIASAITPGDSAFTLSDAAAGQKLVPGEWLVIFERDAAAEEIVAIDWAQVSAVQGSRVDVRHPFRTRFPAARRWVDHVSGLGFHAVHSLLENVTIRNLKLVHDSDERVVPLINIGMALRTRIQDVFVDNIRGNGIALYRAKGASIHNLTVQNAPAQANEIAATVDFRISDSSFGFEASSGRSRPAADTAALNVDFGSAFFAITGNSFHAAGNIAVMFLDGVHDGVFSANTIGWVRAASIELGQGVSARGCQRLVISENSFAGGDRGKGNTCITLADSVQLQPPIESTGNIVQTNSCGGFEHETGPQRSGDRYQ